MDERDFKRQGENIYHRMTEELFKKDKVMQQRFYEQFTNSPPAFREQMMRIEAGVKGFTMQDGYPIKNDSGEPANELELESINKETDKAMLRSNPDLDKYNLRYENGFFIPIDYKKLLEKEG